MEYRHQQYINIVQFSQDLQAPKLLAWGGGIPMSWGVAFLLYPIQIFLIETYGDAGTGGGSPYAAWYGLVLNTLARLDLPGFSTKKRRGLIRTLLQCQPPVGAGQGMFSTIL